MASFQHCRVLVNKLADTPHRQGQIALKAIAHGRVVTISFDRSRYLVHVSSGAAHRLVDECGSVDEARGIALELLQVERSV